jgi:hypothetical protein
VSLSRSGEDPSPKLKKLLGDLYIKSTIIGGVPVPFRREYDADSKNGFGIRAPFFTCRILICGQCST